MTNNTIGNKTYILQKDYNTIAHSYKAGTDVAFINGKYVVGLEIFTEEQVKSMPDWFKEKPIEDKKIKVTTFTAHGICTSKPIPKEKHEPLKKLIEQFLNNEVPDTTVSDIPTLNYQDKVEKPPLGIIPEFIWKEQRLDEINNAIKRYKELSKPIPLNWIAQQYDISCWIQRRNEEKQPQPVPEKHAISKEDIELVMGCYFHFRNVDEKHMQEWIRMQEQQIVNTKINQ